MVHIHNPDKTNHNHTPLSISLSRDSSSMVRSEWGSSSSQDVSTNVRRIVCFLWTAWQLGGSSIIGVMAFPSPGSSVVGTTSSSSARTTLRSTHPTASNEESLSPPPSTADTEWGQAIAKPTDSLAVVDSSQIQDDDEEDVETVDLAIVGGGLAGLAVAVGLQQLQTNHHNDTTTLGHHNLQKIVIYERAPHLRSSSQGVVGLDPNGLRALHHIHADLPRLLTQAGCVSQHFRGTRVDAQGTREEIIMPQNASTTPTTTTATGNSTATSASSSSSSSSSFEFTILAWSRIQQTLATVLFGTQTNDTPDKTEEEQDQDASLTLVTNCSLSYFVDHPDCDHVVLQFDNGKRVRAKAVLACDGVFSVARRQIHAQYRAHELSSSDSETAATNELDPKSVTDAASPNVGGANSAHLQDSPIFFGQLNWATIIPTHKLPPGLHGTKELRYLEHDGEPRWMSMIIDGGGGHPPETRQTNDNDKDDETQEAITFWQFRVANPDVSLSLSGNNGRGGFGLPGVKDGLLPLARAIPEVAAAISATPEAQIFERSIVGRLVLPTWRSQGGGRVVLVGDAAHGQHPNIGQGANSAFESVAALLDTIRTELRNKAVENHDNGSNGPLDWNRVWAAFEAARKPRADLAQRYANMMGILQAVGSVPLTLEQRSIVRTWIRLPWTVDEKLPPEIIEILEAYDPLEQPGVSPLW